MVDDLSFLDSVTLTKVIAAIRESFLRTLEYNVIKLKSVVEEKGPRGGKRFKCNNCSKSFSENEIKVDHIEPVIPIIKSTSEMTLKELYERCHCKIENLQVLCKECHDIKTKDENKKRREFKKLRKVK